MFSFFFLFLLSYWVDNSPYYLPLHPPDHLSYLTKVSSTFGLGRVIYRSRMHVFLHELLLVQGSTGRLDCFAGAYYIYRYTDRLLPAWVQIPPDDSIFFLNTFFLRLSYHYNIILASSSFIPYLLSNYSPLNLRK